MRYHISDLELQPLLMTILFLITHYSITCSPCKIIYLNWFKSPNHKRHNYLPMLGFTPSILKNAKVRLDKWFS